MISLYSGTPGSGKSLHIARNIFWKLKTGGTVIANFPINLSSINNIKGQFFEIDNSVTPDFLISFSSSFFNGKPVKEGKIYLVLDECQLLFNAREWNVSGRAAWLSFFTQHRKFGFDIVLVAQFDRMIDRQIRSLIEYEFKHRKVSNFGIRGKILSLFSGGNLFVSVKIWYPMHEKVDSEFFHSRKKYYQLYDTFAVFGSSEGGGERSSGASSSDESKVQPAS